MTVVEDIAAEDTVDPARELARVTWDAVTPVALALAGLFAGVLLFGLWSPTPATDPVMVAVRAATVVIYLALAVLARREMPAPWLVYTAGIAVVLAAALCNGVVGGIGGEPMTMRTVGVPVIGALALILSTRWALTAVVLCAAVTAALPPPGLHRREVVFVIVASTAVGLALHVARRRTHVRVCELRAKEHAAHAARIDATARLAGGLAHDFNNLLTVIQSEASLLAEGDLSVAEQAVSLASLQEAAGRAAAVTRQLLTFSRRQVMRPVRVAPMPELGRLVRLIRRTLPTNVTVDLVGAATSTMLIDAGQLGQAVLNLALNARDAMPDGGTLRLRVRDVRVGGTMPVIDPPGQVSSPRQPGSYVAIAVEDTGTGMDDDTLGHLFEPFFTTKPAGQGTGLGLSMVHGIVHQHGGFVEVRSRLGRGTTFTLFVPAAPDDGVRPPAPAATTDDHGPRALVTPAAAVPGG